MRGGSGNRWIWIAALLGVLLFRGLHRYHFRSFFTDSAAMLGVARTYQQTGNIGLRVVHPADLANVEVSPVESFLPTWGMMGLPWMNLGLYPLDAAFGTDLVMLLAFLAAFLALLKEVRTGFQAQIWAMIFLGFSLSPFQYLTGSDLAGLAFLTIALWGFFRMMNGKPGSFLLLISGLIAATLFRLQYLALLPAFPLLFVLKRDWKRFRWSFLAFGLWGLVISIAWFGPVWQNPMIGDQSWQLYPQNLLAFDPFPARLLFYYPLTLEAWLTPPLPMVIHLTFWIFSLGLILGLFLRSRPICEGNKVSIEFLTLLIGGIVMLFLSALSLITPAQSWTGQESWTFVQESRYYAPVWVLLLVLTFQKTGEGRGSGKWRLLVGISVGWSLLLLSAYFYQAGLSRSDYQTFPNGAVANTQEFLRNYAPGRPPLVYCSPSLPWQGNLAGIPDLDYSELSKASDLKSDQPRELVVLIGESEMVAAEAQAVISRWSFDTVLIQDNLYYLTRRVGEE